MDRQVFISGRGIIGSVTEKKILKLLNSFTTPQDFRVISDRDGFGYADESSGRGVTLEQAEAILSRRPSNGFQRIFDISGPGLGADTWSDIIISAMRLIEFPTTKSFTVNFTQISSVPDDPTSSLESIDVMMYGKLKGVVSEEWIPLFRQTNTEGLSVSFENIPDDVEQIAIVASRIDDRSVIYRSGPILLSAYDSEHLEATILLVHERQRVAPEIINNALAEQVGLEVDDDTFVRRLNADFIDRRMIISGRITQEDSFLYADSDIDFEVELLMSSTAFVTEGLGARYSVRRTNPDLINLEKLVGVIATNSSSSHSNWLLKAVGLFGVLIPGLPGFIVPSAVIATDNSIDNSNSINRLIATTISEQVVERSFDLLANALEELSITRPTDFSILLSLGMHALGVISEGETVQEKFINIMSRTATVDDVSITPEGIDLSVWLVVPYLIGAAE